MGERSDEHLAFIETAESALREHSDAFMWDDFDKSKTPVGAWWAAHSEPLSFSLDSDGSC